jgi:ADP-ribose pyrophosphatase
VPHDTPEKTVQTCVYKTPIFELHQETYAINYEENAIHYTLKMADAVMILPQLSSKTFLLLLEKRRSVNNSIWGLAGGKIDNQESPLEAAHRELLEETGYQGTLEALGSFYPFPGLSNQRIHFFLATNITFKQEQSLEAGEEISLHQVSLEEMLKIINSQSNVDGILLQAVGLYLIRERQKELQQRFN